MKLSGSKNAWGLMFGISLGLLGGCQSLPSLEGRSQTGALSEAEAFKQFEREAYELGFTHAAVGAMVRSSYHADQQAHGVLNPATA